MQQITLDLESIYTDICSAWFMNEMECVYDLYLSRHLNWSVILRFNKKCCTIANIMPKQLSYKIQTLSIKAFYRTGVDFCKCKCLWIKSSGHINDTFSLVFNMCNNQTIQLVLEEPRHFFTSFIKTLTSQLFIRWNITSCIEKALWIEKYVI